MEIVGERIKRAPLRSFLQPVLEKEEPRTEAYTSQPKVKAFAQKRNHEALGGAGGSGAKELRDRGDESRSHLLGDVVPDRRIAVSGDG